MDLIAKECVKQNSMEYLIYNPNDKAFRSSNKVGHRELDETYPYPKISTSLRRILHKALNEQITRVFWYKPYIKNPHHNLLVIIGEAAIGVGNTETFDELLTQFMWLYTEWVEDGKPDGHRMTSPKMRAYSDTRLG